MIENPILTVQDLSLWYGKSRALQGISMQIPEKKITAFIGPSGCGKSTLLRCFNRMNDLVDGVRTEGTILFEGASIHDPNLDVNALRSRIGMVFQKSNPFPKSIYENVAFGCRIQGINRKHDLDPIATAKVEELMLDLKSRYTLVIVTHNMQQATRVSDYTAFLYLGTMVEYGETQKLFINPAKKQTEDYITGRFG